MASDGARRHGVVRVAKDHIPRTRQALRTLRAEVGGPSADVIRGCMPAGEGPARSTIADLFQERSSRPRGVPLWSTVAPVIEALREHHRQVSGRAAHKELVAAGRFDLTRWHALYLEEVGLEEAGGDAGAGSVFAQARARYLERIRQRYRRVDLEILTPLTDHGEHPVMLLEQVFVPQQVRADPPPVEVPREVWRRLAEAGTDGDCHLPEEIDQERLQAALRAYHDRPARPVLDVIGDPVGRRLVVLGDPGAGKSTLARYLMLALAGPGEEPTDIADAADVGLDVGPTGMGDRATPVSAGLAGWLPLLVELRTYADPGWRNGRSVTFLDLIDHLHATQDVGLPRQVLELFLDEGGPALMIFDGLDEVFDPRLRAEVTAQIEGFAARYPKTRVVVTSRVIGYHRAVLDAAGFTHWMLQDLDAGQVRAFATGWYARSCPTDPSKAARLTERLLAAVDASPAVGELAGNPMLLTILAIIGRRRELPRDRRSVYEHAVTVLVEHWDVNKHLDDAGIDPRTAFLDATDKLELLHQVARAMQGASAGLAGNHIPGPDLVEQFCSYLTDRFDLPTAQAITAARVMRDRFRERNFILARFGSEVYGFVHRAFLEYLAADDLNQRLINLDLTQDQLLAVYDQHWNDPAWSEVLLLLTGMIPDRVACQSITRLLVADPLWRLRPGLPQHLVLGLQAVAEIRRTSVLVPHAATITDALTGLLEETDARGRSTTIGPLGAGSLSASVDAVLTRFLPVVGPTWAGRDRYRRWYRMRGQHLSGGYSYTAARAAARIHIAQLPNPPGDLYDAGTHSSWALREAAVQAIAVGWADDGATLPWLRDRATTDDDGDVRRAAVEAIAVGWADDGATLPWLRDRATTDDDGHVRRAAVEAIAAGWADDEATLPWLRDRATTDDHWDVRRAAVEAIAAGWADDEATLPWLRDRATTDDHWDVRQAAVQAIAAGWADDPRPPCPGCGTAPPPTTTGTCGRRRWRRSRPGGPTTRPPCPGCVTAPPPTTTSTCGGRRWRRSRPGGPTTRPPCPGCATAPPPTTSTPCGGRRWRRSRPGGPTTRPPCPGCGSAPPPTTTGTCGRRRCRRSRPGGPTTRPPCRCCVTAPSPTTTGMCGGWRWR